MTPLTSFPVKHFQGAAAAPGDKSISHRALILSSQAIGAAEITGLLESGDVLNTVKALRALGVSIEKQGEAWRVQGVGSAGLREPESVVDMGNSGTGTRLMMGLVAAYPFSTTFSGDESLSRRPMKRVIAPLERMGAAISARQGGLLPLTVTGSDELMPMTYELPVPSAQVKSAILLAGMNTAGRTTVIEREATRDHTEKMLRYLGADITVTEHGDKREIAVNGQRDLKASNILVPADPSSAAFPVVAALIAPNARITIANVCVNPLRIGLYDTLREMGAEITFANPREEAGEPIADIIASSSRLKGIRVPPERAPSMIDEYPILAVAAAFAEGETLMEGLAELRVKESDRLSAVLEGLKACGVAAEAGRDNLTVKGGRPEGGGTVQTHMDHRIAMAFLVLSMAAKEPVTVDDGTMIDTSFPGFVTLMNGLGADIRPC